MTQKNTQYRQVAPNFPVMYCPNTVVSDTGIGIPVSARDFSNPSLDYYKCLEQQGSVRWPTTAAFGMPSLPSISPYPVVWYACGSQSSGPWEYVLQVMCGTGTGSIHSVTPAAPPTYGRMRADRLAQIQAAFGFTLRDLARVLGISRAQLYKWLDSAREVQLHEESRTRFNAIAQLAAEWQTLSTAPLNAVAQEPVVGAINIVDLMAQQSLDIGLATNALRQLAKQTVPGLPSVTQELSERGFRRHPSARSLPSDV